MYNNFASLFTKSWILKSGGKELSFQAKNTKISKVLYFILYRSIR